MNIEKTIKTIKRNGKYLNAENLVIYSLFTNGKTITTKEAKMYIINLRINHKANQLTFGANNVSQKFNLCPLHISEYNRLF